MERVLEARQDDTWLTRIYPRVREREGKKDKEKGREKSKGVFPPAQVLQTLYPATYFKQPSHFIANSRLLYEVYLWDPADYHNIRVLWGGEGKRLTSIRHITRSWGSDCIRYLPFCSTSILSIGRKIKKCKEKRKKININWLLV